MSDKKIDLLTIEVKATEMTVKNGEQKGKKFLSFKVFNKKTGYYEDLRFNSKVKNAPEEAGQYLLEVPKTQINRIGTERRKYPVTWVSEITSVSTYESVQSELDVSQNDLPF